jgi:hypothetical protein
VDLLRFIPIYVSDSTVFYSRARRTRSRYLILLFGGEFGGGKLFVEDDEASADVFYCGDLFGDLRSKTDGKQVASCGFYHLTDYFHTSSPLKFH